MKLFLLSLKISFTLDASLHMTIPVGMTENGHTGCPKKRLHFEVKRKCRMSEFKCLNSL